MKTLMIMRHAKSSWKKEGLTDHDRPLNRRGKQAAPRVGVFLQAQGWRPEIVFSSTAMRARCTGELVIEAAGWDCPLELRQQLYLAPASEYLQLLAAEADPAASVMVIGHNPGLEQLLAVTSGSTQALPTAAVALVQFDISLWRQLGDPPRGTLLHLWLPREL